MLPRSRKGVAGAKLNSDKPVVLDKQTTDRRSQETFKYGRSTSPDSQFHSSYHILII